MKRILIYLTTGIIFFTTSCAKKVESTQVQINVKNVSSYTYSEVTVNTSGGQNNYGTVLPGQLSAYKTYDFAYSYASVRLVIENEVLTLQAIDYVGETKLKSGAYTYEINASESDGLTLSLAP